MSNGESFHYIHVQVFRLASIFPLWWKHKCKLNFTRTIDRSPEDNNLFSCWMDHSNNTRAQTQAGMHAHCNDTPYVLSLHVINYASMNMT
jgi:hypothetical protein